MNAEPKHVRGFQVYQNGPNVEFYDAEAHLFTVRASSASGESAMQDLLRVWEEAVVLGRKLGRIATQSEIRTALNAASLELD